MTGKEVNPKIKDEEILDDLFNDFENKDTIKKGSDKNNKKTSVFWILGTILLLAVIVYIAFQYLNDGDIQKNISNSTNNNIDTNNSINDIEKTNKDFELEKKAKDYIFDDSNLFANLLKDKSWNIKTNNNFSNAWGEENLSKINLGLKVSYPKDSYKPSVDPRGGAGFIYSLDKSFNKIKLSYNIELAPNFEPIKGGRLPGLCSGTCPRGGMEANKGFAITFSWRKDGYLDILSYLPGENKYGIYTKERFFKLESGKKYNISMDIELNTAGKKDGKLIVYIDGKKYLEKTDILYRNDKNLKIDSLLFTTFFGGNDISFATKNNTFINFSGFKISN